MHADYELRALSMYEQFIEALATIKKMEKIKPHPILKRLRIMFEKSIEGCASLYRDTKVAAEVLTQLTDLLYGKRTKDKETKAITRSSVLYRQQNKASFVKDAIENLIDIYKEKTKHSSTLCRQINHHFENSFNLWKQHIFTCYEYPFIPNDNNALEANHNILKRAIRKITGRKSTRQALLIYGEELLFCHTFFDKPVDDFFSAITNVNFESVLIRNKQLKEQQYIRGKKRYLLKRNNNVLKTVICKWKN